MAHMYVPTVMLIEDDPQFVYLMQRYATSSGCRLVHVEPRAAIIPLAQQEHPDLIMLDLQMPGRDSEDVMRTLRAHPTTRIIPIIICSALDIAAYAWEDEADGRLIKPVMYNDFLAALAEVGVSVPQ